MRHLKKFAAASAIVTALGVCACGRSTQTPAHISAMVRAHVTRVTRKQTRRMPAGGKQIDTGSIGGRMSVWHEFDGILEWAAVITVALVWAGVVLILFVTDRAQARARKRR
jgi:hypothetical protein